MKTEIKDYESIFLKGDAAKSVKAAAYMQEISQQKNKVLELVFGNYAKKIKFMADNIDYDHPEVGSVLNGIFSNKYFSDKISQYIKIANYAVDNKITQIKDLHKAVLCKEPSEFRAIDFPEKNYKNIRLLLDKGMREHARSKRGVKNIDMRAFFRTEDRLKKLHKDFSHYVRYNNAHEKDLKELEYKVEVLNKLSCSYFGSAYKSKIDNLSMSIKNDYVGFRRIRMSDAAAMVAINSGATVHLTIKSLSDAKGKGSARKFVIPGRIMRKYRHENYSGYDSVGSPLKQYDVELKAYPYSVFEDIASEEIKNVVKHTEEMPEFNGKPIFDHYMVVTPSVNFPPEPNCVTKDSVEYAFTYKKVLYKFKELKECSTALDRAMTSERDINPVLLGERDGECYFICNWN